VVNFTITANDNTGGSGIKNITLYIDGTPVQTWTTAGAHNYTGGPYSQGTHTYYAEVFDNANNKGREPATGNNEFTVAQPPLPSWMLWVIRGIIATLVVVTVTMIVWLRRKK
jgi:hypothetical protein